MIDFLNWPDIAGLPRMMHLLLAALVILPIRATIQDWLTESPAARRDPTAFCGVQSRRKRGRLR